MLNVNKCSITNAFKGKIDITGPIQCNARFETETLRPPYASDEAMLNELDAAIFQPTGTENYITEFTGTNPSHKFKLHTKRFGDFVVELAKTGGANFFSWIAPNYSQVYKLDFPHSDPMLATRANNLVKEAQRRLYKTI